MRTKQLRYMSAHVITVPYNGYPLHILKSYETLVAAYYPHDKLIMLAEKWQCSNTTMRHVRAFLNDYADIDTSVVTLRKYIPPSHQLTGEIYDMPYLSETVYITRTSWIQLDDIIFRACITAR